MCWGTNALVGTLRLVRALLFVSMLVGCGPRVAPAIEKSHPVSAIVPDEPAQTVAATIPLHWVGEWTAPSEAVRFGFDIRLTAKSSGLEGRILWTLLSVPPGHFLSARVNDSGQEFVHGTFNSSTRELHLKGTSVDDNTLLATDEYKLIISADNNTFDGRTRGNKGDWANEITGRRADD